MPEQFVTVARLRAELADVLAHLDPDRPLYVLQRGHVRAVLLDVERYRALIEQLEHLDDSLEALLARERRVAGESTRPLSELLAERDGSPRPRRPPTRRVNARVSR